MKLYLKLPEGPETPVNLNLIPKTGEKIDYAGSRYLIVSVVHNIEANRTTLELVRIEDEEAHRHKRLNEVVRYRTTDIRAYSPPARSRFGS